ncbi:hypothetical protein A8709_16835 [Paenibacillus pectinilyticus]|uniref:SLH domain-containing protein n=1 Tax=Paenibacillus pectinilyticus TaxID=512399 RepID=A0A1C1A8K1_9BACL|nr:S-layer homology domain-containing protein [Paenibacillus pectinilyticus]OCT16937.1 hypothetical protein A8709_16835 [Paenibacillus pectinilyticus]
MQLSKFSSKISLILVFMLSFTFNGFIGGIPSTRAAETTTVTATTTPVNTLGFSQGISDWIADWNTGYLYAVSSSTNKLYFIRASDLTIQKELAVGSQPVSIARNGNTLFIALSGSTLIQQVDLTTQSLGPSLPINVKPTSVAVTSDYLFYGTSSWDNYSYNRSNGNIEKISSNHYQAVFTADESTNTLYIGETGLSSSKLSAYNYLTNTILSSSTYFEFPNRKIIFDGQNVFYAGSKLNGSNLKEINGAYKRYGDYSYLDSKILDINGKFLLTSQSIFNIDTGVKLADLPYEISYGLLDNDGTAYVYDSKYGSSHNKIEAYQLDLSHAYSMQSNSKGNYIKFSDPISAFATDDSSPYIHVVSKVTNEWLVIRKSDMSVVKQELIGSNPTDVQLQNGKLFFALRGETHLAVVDAVYQTGNNTPINSYLIGSNPDRVYPANGLMYYWGQGFENMGVYNLAYGTNYSLADKHLPISFQYDGAYFDTVTSAMYGAGSVTQHAGNSIFQVDPTNLTGNPVIQLDYSQYSGKLLKDNNQFYYGNQRYSVTGVVYGTYPEPVLYAKGLLVFSQNAVYDRDTFVKIKDLPFSITGAFVSQNGEILLSTTTGLYKFANLSDIDSFIRTQLLARTPVLWDEDTQENYINGHIYMKPARDSDSISSYQFNFLDANQKNVGYVSVSNMTILPDGTMDFSLNGNFVPDKAVSLGVYSYSKGISGSNTLINIPVIFPLWDAPTYLPTQVNLTEDRNVSGEFKGTLTWKPAKKETVGTVYRIYYIDNNDMFGAPLGEVVPGQTTYSVKLDLKNVPDSALGIALVVETIDGRQPYYVNVKFFSTKTSTGGSGGAGGGGGGGGASSPIDWDFVHQDNSLRVTSSITAEKLKNLYTDQLKDGNNTLEISLEGKVDGYDFLAPAKALSDMLNVKADATIQIKTSLGSIKVPGNVLKDVIQKISDLDNSKLQFQIENLANLEQNNIVSYLGHDGSKLVGTPLSFELYAVDSKNQKVSMNTFSQYIGHSVVLPSDFKLNDDEILVGAVWNPEKKTLINVPFTIQHNEDKSQTATWWRNGNSTYVLYKAKNKEFPDVSKDYFAKDAVSSLAAKGIINGFEDGTFKGEQSVTRAQFASLLVRALGLKGSESSTQNFKDIEASDWFYQDVLTAASRELLSGYEDATFRPNQEISHQEALVMLANAYHFLNPGATLTEVEKAQLIDKVKKDIQVEAWAASAEATAVKLNLIKLDDVFTFDKDISTNRGQTALLFYRFITNLNF